MQKIMSFQWGKFIYALVKSLVFYYTNITREQQSQILKKTIHFCGFTN